MTSKEFHDNVIALGCPEKAATGLIRLVSRLSTNCATVSMDDLLTLSLEMIPRAQDTYRDDRAAAFTTHLITVVRNACLSLLSKERKHEFRTVQLDRERHDILSERAPPDHAALGDEFDALEQILSPFAWRMFVLMAHCSPVTLSNRVISEELGLSATSVNHLRDEVRFAVGVVLNRNRFGKIKHERS